MRRELDKVAEEASREVEKNWKEQGTEGTFSHLFQLLSS